MSKSIPFEQVLNQYLQDPEKAMSYLRSALEENDPILFQAALQDVLQVQKDTIATTTTFPSLVNSLKKHGVAEEIIQAVVNDLNISTQAA